MAVRIPGMVSDQPPGRMLAVLHPVFALTGICHSIGGPLLPSLAPAFHLNDSQAGFLLFAYFVGTSAGALLCGRHHVRTLTFGFLALAGACVAVAAVNRTLVYPLFFVLGLCVGAPMTAVTMLAGRTFGTRSAAPLTFLNFTWSAGALAAPLLAARLLANHTFRAAYAILACAALAAALACLQLQESPEPVPPAAEASRIRNLPFVGLFALLAFLEVGIENTAGSWLATYVLRTSGAGAAWAAASSSLYWCGFLVSRGVWSLLLLRIDPGRVLRFAVSAAMVAAAAMLLAPGMASRVVAMTILGATLAPVFPLLLARFFAHARQSSDSRWVLSICGFGGSVLPWLTGWISARSGSLRLGLATLPAALVLMIAMLPVLTAWATAMRKSAPPAAQR